MTVEFTPFTTDHFPLLYYWLQQPHVVKWWGEPLSLDGVYEKYTSYVNHFKIEKGVRKTIDAFIILVEGLPVGYAQLYDVHDFSRKPDICPLPKNTCSFDFYIGEPDMLRKGIATTALQLFSEHYIFAQYRYCFADPNMKNEAAIRIYLKSGFEIYKKQHPVLWMIKTQKHVRMPACTVLQLEILFTQHFLPHDHLWIFGSRADLNRKGGDIDLYIHTSETDIHMIAQRKIQFHNALIHAIGDQKIDIVIQSPNTPSLLIYQIAQANGIQIL